jgi:hypothetical protein
MNASASSRVCPALRRDINMNERRIIGRYQLSAVSAYLTSAIALVGVTPICGLLFQCHCDWPWLTFYFDCNFFDAEVRHQCPWCASGWTGVTAIAAAFLLAAAAAALPLPNQNASQGSMTVRVTRGLAVFMLSAIAAGALTAHKLQYPLGIGGLLLAYSESHMQ